MAKEYLTEDQAAALIGVSRPTMWRLRKHEGLPYILLGTRTVRYERAAIDDWMATRMAARVVEPAPASDAPAGELVAAEASSDGPEKS